MFMETPLCEVTEPGNFSLPFLAFNKILQVILMEATPCPLHILICIYSSVHIRQKRGRGKGTFQFSWEEMEGTANGSW